MLVSINVTAIEAAEKQEEVENENSVCNSTNQWAIFSYLTSVSITGVTGVAPKFSVDCGAKAVAKSKIGKNETKHEIVIYNFILLKLST